MKITICGSMSFAKEMWEISRQLEGNGHRVFLPDCINEFMEGGKMVVNSQGREKADFKKKHDLIRKHYQNIKESQAILVINKEKKNIKNYIGANTLIEMGFAHCLDKKIYLLNDLPEFDYLLEEVKAMEPIILNRDLSKIE